jgi:hypothetical protein
MRDWFMAPKESSPVIGAGPWLADRRSVASGWSRPSTTAFEAVAEVCLGYP